MNSTSKSVFVKLQGPVPLTEMFRSLLLVYLIFAVGNHALAADTPHSGHEAGAASKTVKPTREKTWQAALSRPSLATTTTFDEDGRLWRVMTRERRVLVSHSSDGGRSFSVPVAVNSTPEHIAGDGENRPKIVVRKGVVHVSWTQPLDMPMTGHIRFSRSLDGGKTFSPPVTVNDDPQIISHRFEAMGVNDRGQVYLAWLDKRDLAAAQQAGQPYAGAAIYYAVSNDRGASFLPNRKLADHTCECCRVALAMDADGTPVVFWRHIYGRNTRDFALARLDDRPVPVRATYDNWEVDGCPHHGGAVSVGKDGTYHLVWFTNAPAQSGLFYASSRDRGQRFSPPQAFGNEDAQAGHPDVLSLGQDVLVAWKEFDGKQASIELMRSPDGGRSWARPQRLAVTRGGSDHPQLIAAGDKAYLSWQTEQDGLLVVEISRP